jgi:hypothetical protein
MQTTASPFRRARAAPEALVALSAASAILCKVSSVSLVAGAGQEREESVELARGKGSELVAETKERMLLDCDMTHSQENSKAKRKMTDQ